MVESAVLVFSILNYEFFLRIVDNDIGIKTYFYSALAVIYTEEFSRVCS